VPAPLLPQLMGSTEGQRAPPGTKGAAGYGWAAGGTPVANAYGYPSIRTVAVSGLGDRPADTKLVSSTFDPNSSISPH